MVGQRTQGHGERAVSRLPRHEPDERAGEIRVCGERPALQLRGERVRRDLDTLQTVASDPCSDLTITGPAFRPVTRTSAEAQQLQRGSQSQIARARVCERESM